MATTENLEGLETPVVIYVRKGIDATERVITFVIPEWLSQGEILDREWAIDGNQVLFTVPRSELHTAETELVCWFREKGHPLTFS